MASIPFQTAFGSHRPDDLHFGEDEVSLTHQSMKDECDINLIMARYQSTGLIEHVNQFEGNYGDFMDATDYHSAMNEVLAANDAFASLPSSIRERFSNDPAQFLDFVHDDKNRDEMIKMGLIEEPILNVNSSVNSDQSGSSSVQDA